MAFPNYIATALSILFAPVRVRIDILIARYFFERRDRLPWGIEQLFDYFPSMGAIVATLFLEVVFGRD